MEIINLTSDSNEETEKQIKRKIKDECSKVSVEINLMYKSSLIENLREQEKQLYIINSGNSLVSLILLQLVSRAIFEADEKIALQIKRKESL